MKKTIEKINTTFVNDDPCWCQPGKKQFFLFSIALILTGCFQHYYKTNSESSVDNISIEKLKVSNKYFIIHFGNNIKGAVKLKTTNDLLEADLVPLPMEHSNYTKPKGNAENLMKVKHQAYTLLEVHLYTPLILSQDQTHITLPINSINRIDVYEFDKEATTHNRATSIIGVALGTLLITSTILAITNPVVSF